MTSSALAIADKPRPVRIVYGGKAYSGHYHVADGLLHISSPSGSGSEPLGRKAPERLLEALFRRIVDEEADSQG